MNKISLKTHKGIGLNLDLYFHKTPKVTMNWESYAIIVFLNQILSKFKYRRRRLIYIFLLFTSKEERETSSVWVFLRSSCIASRQKISSALAYLFIFKQPLFVLLYLSKPLSLAGNLVQQGP